MRPKSLLLEGHWPMEWWGDNKGNLIKMHPHSRNKLLLEFLGVSRNFIRRHVFRYVKNHVDTYVDYIVSARWYFFFIYRHNFLLRYHYYVIIAKLIFFVILNAANFHIQYSVLHKIIKICKVERARYEEKKKGIRKKKKTKCILKQLCKYDYFF